MALPLVQYSTRVKLKYCMTMQSRNNKLPLVLLSGYTAKVAGTEIGVASTKAFTAQVTILTLLAWSLAQIKGTISRTRMVELLTALEAIPAKVEKALTSNDQIQVIAANFKDAPNFLYLGRGFNFPVALEGALKLEATLAYNSPNFSLNCGSAEFT